MRTVSLSAPLRELAQAVRELVTGGTNAAGTVSVGTGTTKTVVKNDLVTPNSWIFLTPQSSNAAALGAFVAVKSVGSFTVGHASGSTADLAFDYLILHG